MTATERSSPTSPGSLDVIGHELDPRRHRVHRRPGYHKQPGALNESISDVFGSLVKQWSLRQTADRGRLADRGGRVHPRIDADALRSMKAPGTAYDSALFGNDPQPDHMNNFVHLPDTEDGDWGGVHINSGHPEQGVLPGGHGDRRHRWEAAGPYLVRGAEASSARTQFQEFADTTYFKAAPALRGGRREQQAVLDGLAGGRHPDQRRFDPPSTWQVLGRRLARRPGAAS